MKICFISDTHDLHDRMAPLPEGDILLRGANSNSTSRWAITLLL